MYPICTLTPALSALPLLLPLPHQQEHIRTWYGSEFLHPKIKLFLPLWLV